MATASGAFRTQIFCARIHPIAFLSAAPRALSG
jgi:hypothetical protein